MTQSRINIPFLAFFACLLGVLNLEGMGQATVPEVQYVDNEFRTEIPYGQAFIITGSTDYPGGKADVVKLTILVEKNRKKRKKKEGRVQTEIRPEKQVQFYMEKPFYTGFWRRGKEDNVGEFELYVAQTLPFDTRYMFRLEFFHRFQLGDKQLDNLVNEVIIASGKKYNNQQEISLRDINAVMNEVAQKYSGDAGRNFGYLDFKDSDATFLKTRNLIAPPIVGDSAVISNAIGNIVRDQNTIMLEKKDIKRYRGEIMTLRNQKPYVTLLDELSKARKNNRSVEGVYSEVDITVIERFVQDLPASNYQDVDNAFLNILGFIGESNDSSYISRGSFNELLDLFDKITNLNNNRQNLERKKKALGQNNAILGEEDLSTIIAKGFVLGGTATIVPVPNNTAALRTKLDAVTIGTAYGIGVAGLNLNFGNSAGAGTGDGFLSNVEADMFSYIGLKFFLSPVDKRIESPYLSARHKFSILAGAAVSENLSYRGQTFLNPIGFKPVLGLSYDLSKLISVEAGAIFFKATALSPLLTNTQLRAAPFIGISIDADGFNRGKTLLSGETFRIPAQPEGGKRFLGSGKE